MSTHPIHVFSEIGKLKKVMLHRPGKELENLLPDYLERLLFDDIPFLEDAQKEHDAFAQALRDEGIGQISGHNPRNRQSSFKETHRFS